MNKQKNELVSKYLHEVQSKLPEWLKGNKDEVTDILTELEEHIYDRAMDISDSDSPDQEAIQQAIEKMGSPSKIASSYKQRGKPKYFITEELWPLYVKVMLLINGVLFAIVTSVLIIFSSPDELLGKVLQYFGGLYFQVAIISFIITIVFVYLSKEGFLPENLSDIDIKTPEIETPEYFYKPREYLLAALITAIFGFLLVIQRFFPFTHITTNEMQNWMLLLGLILSFDAFLELLKLKNSITAHKVLMIVDVITNIPMIVLFIVLASAPEMMFSFVEIPLFIFPWVFGFVALIIAFDGVVTVYKVYKMQQLN
ncbi:MAG: HAAS signaling domain-containing protein [Candidatus Hodarchaeales archaeon]|jgi:hypothetical protein